MTTIPPGQPVGGPPVPPADQPPGGPVVSPGGNRRRWSRVLLVAAAVAVVGFLVAGAGAYVAMSRQEKAQGTVDCGPYECIPVLKASSVVAAIEAQGHECVANDNGSACELRIGLLGFEARLEVAEDHLHGVYITASQPEGDQESGAIVPYLSWFASLPYGDDAATTSDITGWLAEQVEGRKATKATIGDYLYEVDASKGTYVELQFRGNWQ